jgi:pimeloyl-ACP methyl ester carboxylesterase
VDQDRDDDRGVDESTPVMCVHGWGGSFTDTWERNGFTALLGDAGRSVIGVDLLGHGTAPKPHEPEAYADLTGRVVDALPDTPIDAIGFSMGALTLLRTASEHPGAFRRLVLAGIGKNVFEADEDRTAAIARAVSGEIDDEDNVSRLFAQYASRPGNDPIALAAVLRQPQRIRLDETVLSSIDCPTLVIVGDRDFVHPADRLVEAIPGCRSIVLRNVDHFATPEDFGFVDAALEFIGAVPT